MSNLYSISEILQATGAAYSQFLAHARPIVVFKEPIKEISITDNPYPGYNSSSETVNYTPVSGVFLAKIQYSDQSQPFTNGAPVPFSDGKIKIKVQPEARAYISTGRTENIIVDGFTFNVESEENVRNYLGFVLHEFILRRTK